MGEEREDLQKIKRIAAAAYDYENDPRWADYRSNFLIPPHMAASTHVVDRIKRKFYQRYIDRDLVVESMSQPSESSTSSTSTATTNNRPRRRNSAKPGSSASRSSRTSTDAAAAYDYENDPRWADYRSNILIPPHMAASSHVVDRIKRKFYQRYIDRGLVLKSMSQPTKSSTSSTLMATTNNRPRRRNSAKPDIEQLPKIVMIDDLSTSDEVKQFTEIVSNCSVLAVDGEWDRQNCCFYQTNGIKHEFNPIELLQLCVLWGAGIDESTVYLLDMQKIFEKSSLSKEISGIIANVLCSDKIIKLGFQCQNDLRTLDLSILEKHLKPCGKICQYLEILDLYKKQTGIHIVNNTPSLATICLGLLGYKLSKEEQKGSWSMRPLSENQKIYAAQDVHCLLQIYLNFINKTKYNIRDFLKVLEFSPLKRKQKKKNKQKNKQKEEKEEVREQNKQKGKVTVKYPLPWDKSLGGDGVPKFLCDPTHKGIIDALKLYKINVMEFPSCAPEQLAQVLQDICMREGRLILTHYNKLLLSNHCLDGKIIIMDIGIKKNEIRNRIIKEFFTLGCCVDHRLCFNNAVERRDHFENYEHFGKF